MVITGMSDFQVGNPSYAECCQVPEPAAAAVNSDVLLPLVLVPLRGADELLAEQRRVPAAPHASRLVPEPLRGDAVPLDEGRLVMAASDVSRLVMAPIPDGDGSRGELASMPAALRGDGAPLAERPQVLAAQHGERTALRGGGFPAEHRQAVIDAHAHAHAQGTGRDHGRAKVRDAAPAGFPRRPQDCPPHMPGTCCKSGKPPDHRVRIGSTSTSGIPDDGVPPIVRDTARVGFPHRRSHCPVRIPGKDGGYGRLLAHRARTASRSVAKTPRDPGHRLEVIQKGR